MVGSVVTNCPSAGRRASGTLGLCRNNHSARPGDGCSVMLLCLPAVGRFDGSYCFFQNIHPGEGLRVSDGAGLGAAGRAGSFPPISPSTRSMSRMNWRALAGRTGPLFSHKRRAKVSVSQGHRRRGDNFPRRSNAGRRRFFARIRSKVDTAECFGACAVGPRSGKTSGHEEAFSN